MSKRYVYHVKVRATLDPSSMGTPDEVKLELTLPAIVLRKPAGDRRRLCRRAARDFGERVAFKLADGKWRPIATKSWEPHIAHESVIEEGDAIPPAPAPRRPDTETTPMFHEPDTETTHAED